MSGDGSVKLILHNDNTTKVANPCDAANNSASAAFARYSGEKYTSKFNTNYDDNAYVGFKYGTVGASDYASAHANINNSTILTNLETWYTNNLKTYADTIADTVWCNDKTNVTDTTYNPWNMSNVNGLGYGTNKTYYGATQRLVSRNILWCYTKISK
ncbi:unknown [Clostridium sp. CAG:533]|nr:unknown [Clostridium sp. CAG:533]